MKLYFKNEELMLANDIDTIIGSADVEEIIEMLLNNYGYNYSNRDRADIVLHAADDFLRHALEIGLNN